MPDEFRAPVLAGQALSIPHLLEINHRVEAKRRCRYIGSRRGPGPASGRGASSRGVCGTTTVRDAVQP
eukprot:496165-Prymnesium_polylepis.1